MTKEKFMFELIDQCIYVDCMDNIMVENFELRDDRQFYAMIEKQFIKCMKFYEDMMELCLQGRITFEQLDYEMEEVLALLKQNVLKRIVDDFKKYLEYTSLDKTQKRRGIQEFKEKLMQNKMTRDFLLEMMQKFRRLEEQGEDARN